MTQYLDKSCSTFKRKRTSFQISTRHVQTEGIVKSNTWIEVEVSNHKATWVKVETIKINLLEQKYSNLLVQSLNQSVNQSVIVTMAK